MYRIKISINYVSVLKKKNQVEAIGAVYATSVSSHSFRCRKEDAYVYNCMHICCYRVMPNPMIVILPNKFVCFLIHDEFLPISICLLCICCTIFQRAKYLSLYE